MGIFTSLIIALLAMVIQAFMQVSPGLFMIFYHHALGKTTAKKADDRSLSYILGAEIFVSIVFLITYIITTSIISEKDFPREILLWVMSGIFLAEALITFLFYFRPSSRKSKKSKTKGGQKSQSTKLFIPRHVAESLSNRAGEAKSRSDTIVLGLVSCVFELPFTLPLYIISSIAIYNISVNSGFLFIIAYIVVATLPLFTIRTLFRTNHNLAEIQRSRAKKKLFFRLIISISFLILAILTFITGVHPL